MIGFKLRLIHWITPTWFYNRILEELKIATIQGLTRLLKTNCSDDIYKPLRGNLDDRRYTMAEIHNQLVKEIINTFGYEEGIKLGKNSMFNVGIDLGKKFKKVLGVDDSLEELIMAAEILYNGLGIEFEISTFNGDHMMVVNRCALAQIYTPEACKIMSGADEGVVAGLNPQIRMEFKQRITEGSSSCRAEILMEKLL
jgi:hypothetical protein